MLATLTGPGAAARTAAPAYVRDVFDELADSFEEKLVSHLAYRVPWQLLEVGHYVRLQVRDVISNVMHELLTEVLIFRHVG